MRPSPGHAADQQLPLRFFDLDVQIRSDDGAHLERFARMYGRFVVDGIQAATAPSEDDGGDASPARYASRRAQYAIWTQPAPSYGLPVYVFDGKAHPLPDVEALAPFVYQDIVCDILSRVRSHILIHAGVVAREGRGILLVADSFHGKTTLVLALVRRGFQFLSDETAALGRGDRLVHPFPRSLSVRAGTLERIGCRLPTGAPTYAGKWILDVEQIQPGCIGQAVPVRHVLLLSDPERPVQEEAEQGFKIIVNRLDEELLAEIGQIDGVRIASPCAETLHGHPLIRLRAAHRTQAYSQIAALCKTRGVWILDVIAGSTGAPSFASPARLEPLSLSQAVLELLRRYQGGYRSAVMDELGGNSTRLFVELAAILGQASCHRLYVGPLEEMVQQVCGLF